MNRALRALLVITLLAGGILLAAAFMARPDGALTFPLDTALIFGMGACFYLSMRVALGFL